MAELMFRYNLIAGFWSGKGTADKNIAVFSGRPAFGKRQFIVLRLFYQQEIFHRTKYPDMDYNIPTNHRENKYLFSVHLSLAKFSETSVLLNSLYESFLASIKLFAKESLSPFSTIIVSEGFPAAKMTGTGGWSAGGPGSLGEGAGGWCSTGGSVGCLVGTVSLNI